MRIERVNIGQLIKGKVMEDKRSISSFAKSIGIQRQNIEKTVFDKISIDTNLLSKISEELNHNFFQYYKSDEECNKNNYNPNGIKEVKAFVKVQYGEEIKEQAFSFTFKEESE